MISGLVGLDAAAVLTASESLVREQRELAVDELRLVLQWADLHSADPGDRRVPGSNRLVQLGGEGTPAVQELCWAELAIARQAGVIATERLAADALDLRHRLPRTWATVTALTLPAWVGRKVAGMSRELSLAAAQVVDTAVAQAARQSPSRVLAIAEAKVMEADPAAHLAKVEADLADIGVRLSRPRPGSTIDPFDGEAGTRRLTLKLPVGLALDVHAAIRERADALQEELRVKGQTTPTRGEIEAAAIEHLFAPPDAAQPTDSAAQPAADARPPARRPATIYVHLAPGSPVARVEEVGPLLVEQLAELLHRRDITVRPVIDLNHVQVVNGYEHPTAVKTRAVLRMAGDVFPHSSIGTGRVDHDHCTPFDDTGPPGQTGDRNDAPLARRHHRIKTHQHGWDLRQVALGAYRWVTPHGLGRMVTPSGTRAFEPIEAGPEEVIGEIYWE